MMYATCVNRKGANALELGKEYAVLYVRAFYGFGDGSFYILEFDGRAYASCHFSVTYLKD